MEQFIDVRAIRESLNLSQAALAAELGVDQSTVSNWENGTQPRGPARKLLESLCSRPTTQTKSRVAI
ncbi:MAG: helix-turn-helix domain-containing protein [Sphingomonadaceae bacterium]|nr:helix-turn-helix domain-containing protein [Sphingomonadaceae bacterium]